MDKPLALRTVNITRYVTPLREGGSMPAIAEADDQFLYVLKFRGAGQGKKALISEIIGGEIARALGLRIPEIVFATVDIALGRIEGDEEIQDLLKASVGLNLALHYLSGSITFDPLATPVDATLASQIVWLDSLLMNVDRTVRNTNMLWWHKELWLIDHGAALYFHHTWNNWQQAERPFPMIKDHVLLYKASELETVNTTYRTVLTPEKIQAIVALIPDEWLTEEPAFDTVEAHRQAYAQFLTTRVAHADFLLTKHNMPENHLFEYAVIRVVPRVEREEFINVGVILYCSAQKFLQARFHVKEDRLRSLCLKTDFEELQGYITSFERICAGGAAGGSIGRLPMAERFRWLTATRSTVVQTSKVHPGLCPDAAEMFDRLFHQLVL